MAAATSGPSTAGVALGGCAVVAGMAAATSGPSTAGVALGGCMAEKKAHEVLGEAEFTRGAGL